MRLDLDNKNIKTHNGTENMDSLNMTSKPKAQIVFQIIQNKKHSTSTTKSRANQANQN